MSEAKMWKISILTLSIFLFISLFTVFRSNKKENTGAQEKGIFNENGFGLSLTANKGIYKEGEPIELALKVFNYSKDNVIFNFKNGQRYDFIIENEEGEKVWQWSQGKMFTMALGREILGPDNREIVYKENYSGKLKPGNYKITGIFTSMERMMGSIEITVK